MSGEPRHFACRTESDTPFVTRFAFICHTPLTNAGGQGTGGKALAGRSNPARHCDCRLYDRAPRMHWGYKGPPRRRLRQLVTRSSPPQANLRPSTAACSLLAQPRFACILRRLRRAYPQPRPARPAAFLVGSDCRDGQGLPVVKNSVTVGDASKPLVVHGFTPRAAPPAPRRPSRPRWRHSCGWRASTTRLIPAWRARPRGR